MGAGLVTAQLQLPDDAPVEALCVIGGVLDACLADVREQLLDSYLDRRDGHAVELRQALLDTERHLERACELLGGPLA